MTTFIALPNIRTKADLAGALARLDAIIDAPDGSPEADERMGLSDLIAAYEGQHSVVPRGGPLGVLRRLMETQSLSQRDLPEIGAQRVVSAVLLGKRVINARMAVALSKRFGIPVAPSSGQSHEFIHSWLCYSESRQGVSSFDAR
jgi:HTH-type transcriptional regulator/antitoxin HigA